MSTPNPLPEFQFGVASVVPAEFLNQLDDVLYAFGDSILPTHTGTQVFVQATAGDEAQVAIERRYFIQATSIYEPVVGDPATYNLYAVASYVPTSHATTVKSFDLVVGTEAPNTFEYVRHLAEVEFDGTFITDVRQNPRKLNAAQLDGHLASTEPTAEVVPVASSSGKLARGFRPLFPGVDVELGDVIDWWQPAGMAVNVPPLYELCLGQHLGPDEQDISTATITLPNLVDKMIFGADKDTAWGTNSAATNSAAGAPGVGGGKAAHFAGAAVHGHSLAAHGHDYPHTHAVPHHHVVDDHTHSINRQAVSHGVYADPPWGQRKRINASGIAVNYTPTTIPAGLGDQGVERGSYNPASDDPNPAYARGADVTLDATSSGVLSTASRDTAEATPNMTNVNPGTTSGTDALTDSSFPAVEPRPAFQGFMRVMKVRV